MNFTLLQVTLIACLATSLCLGCNDVVCGPIVTKCQLLKACNCEMPDKGDAEKCTCCAECAACLEDKYPTCCSCVGE